MIALGEPLVDALKIKPWQGSFFYRGDLVVFRVSVSIGRHRLPDTYHAPLEGDYCRAWLGDPCTMIFEHAMRSARASEDEAMLAWKAKRREERARLAELDRDAKKGRPRRRAW